jgi:hypothetical protein
MVDLIPVAITAAIIVGLVFSQIFRRGFDPFAPVWLFLAGYFQVYVIQAVSYRSYGLRARGDSILLMGNIRSLWALVLFLAVYYCGIGKVLAARLPKCPRSWSPGAIVILTPPMIFWGLICSVMSVRIGTVGGEDSLLTQFPMMLLVAGVLLLVTGRSASHPRPLFTAAGLAVCVAYCVIWMFNGKRSHSLFAVLAGVSAYYLPRLRRPSLPIMAVTGVACAMVVSVAIGWRGTTRYDENLSGFMQYLGEFQLDTVLVNLNIKDRPDDSVDPSIQSTKETEEIGGYWLMLDTVPEKSPYDYGASYIRIVSTFIPRVLWPSKPYYGREEWVSAWIAGSEMHRDETFTGPAIGLLGATQLNGGATATAIVMAVLALMIRTAYDYYRFNADQSWAQAWWSLTYFNAWLMNANDDPFVWFYYVYGYTTLPVMLALFAINRLMPSSSAGMESSGAIT